MLRLTERDKALIVKCSVCRWLTTSQVRRLYFPRATVNAVQKRLRKLSEEGYLRTHREDLLSEAIHAVGPKGKTIAEEKGVEAAVVREVPRQIAHLRGVNDIRIAVETGAVRVAYFFAHWQLANLGWTYPVIPDAIFAGRVVLELDPSQVEIVRADSRTKEKTPAELLDDEKKREKAFTSFFEGMVKDPSRANREKGGDGNVTGIVVE